MFAYLQDAKKGHKRRKNKTVVKDFLPIMLSVADDMPEMRVQGQDLSGIRAAYQKKAR